MITKSFEIRFPSSEEFIAEKIYEVFNLPWDETEKECCSWLGDDFVILSDEGKPRKSRLDEKLGLACYRCRPHSFNTEKGLRIVMQRAQSRIAAIRTLCRKMNGQPPEGMDIAEFREFLDKTIKIIKERLPAVSFMATFTGASNRKAENATPTGLVLIDIDHMEGDPREVYEKEFKPRQKELGIVFSQVSPRGYGLHLVLKGVPGMDIRTQQAFFANATGHKIDTSCSDLSRLCFMSTPEDVLCLDWQGMQQGYFEVIPEIYKAELKMNKEIPTVNNKQFLDEPSAKTELQMNSVSTPTPSDLGSLYEAYFKKHGFPYVGNRNNKVFAATCCIRYASKDAFALKQAIMPFANGLPEREVEQAIRSALSQSDNDANRGELQKLQREFSQPYEVEEDDEEKNPIEKEMEYLEKNLPWLPPVIKEEVARIPAPLKPAAICMCLPVLGALTTKVQAIYRSCEVHTTSFQVIVEGGSGSNKSSMAKTIVDSLWEVQKQYEEHEREKQALHNEELQAKGGVEEIRSKANYAPRKVGITSSITQILRIMKNNKGRHIFAFGHEIDDLTASTKKGFTDKTTLLREAFENSERSQDFNSEKSFSGTVDVFFNTLFLGTLGAVMRFFNADNCKNGTGQRILFARIPTECEEEIKPLPEADRQYILRYLRGFSEEVGTADKPLVRKTIDLNWLKDEMELWVKIQKRVAAETLVRHMGPLSHRAAVYGFRAGLLAMALLGLEKEEQLDESLKKNISEFAHWIAHYTLCGQLLHGVEAEDDKAELRQRAPKPMPKLFKMMPDTGEFSTQDIAMAAKQLKFQTRAARIAEKWRNAGLIEAISKGVYRKIG